MTNKKNLRLVLSFVAICGGAMAMGIVFFQINDQGKPTPRSTITTTQTVQPVQPQAEPSPSPKFSAQEGKVGMNKFSTFLSSLGYLPNRNKWTTYNPGDKVTAKDGPPNQNGCIAVKCSDNLFECESSPSGVYVDESNSDDKKYYNDGFKWKCKYDNSNNYSYTTPTYCTGACPSEYVRNGNDCEVAQTNCGAGHTGDVTLTKDNACTKSLLSGGITSIEGGKKWTCRTQLVSKTCRKCDTPKYILNKDSGQCELACHRATNGFPYCFSIDFSN